MSESKHYMTEQLPQILKAKANRISAMKKLRDKKGWTLQQIADKYDITRQRVHALIGAK